MSIPIDIDTDSQLFLDLGKFFDQLKIELGVDELDDVGIITTGDILSVIVLDYEAADLIIASGTYLADLKAQVAAAYGIDA